VAEVLPATGLRDGTLFDAHAQLSEEDYRLLALVLSRSNRLSPLAWSKNRATEVMRLWGRSEFEAEQAFVPE
jgi:hypothetical protein